MDKGRYFGRSMILLCVRWYLAHGFSLRDLEKMMAERRIFVDHMTIHLWMIHYAPLHKHQTALTGMLPIRSWVYDKIRDKAGGFSSEAVMGAIGSAGCEDLERIKVVILQENGSVAVGAKGRPGTLPPEKIVRPTRWWRSGAR